MFCESNRSPGCVSTLHIIRCVHSFSPSEAGRPHDYNNYTVYQPSQQNHLERTSSTCNLYAVPPSIPRPRHDSPRMTGILRAESPLPNDRWIYPYGYVL